MQEIAPWDERQLRGVPRHIVGWRRSSARGRRRYAVLHAAIVLLLPLLLGGCLREESNDTIDLEGAEIVVEDGAFTDDSIELIAGDPSVLSLENRDSEDYRFEIEDLVTITTIPAGETVDIQLTTPTAGEFEGMLLAGEADAVVDTLSVIVRAPGGVS